MSTPPARRRPPVQPDHAVTGTDRPVPPAGRLRRLLARVGAAVRGAHSASVPF